MPVWSDPEFDWDDDNVEHLMERHGIHPEEAEQVFYNGPHVRRGRRVYLAYGQDDAGRYLAVIFVTRGSRVRVISARPMIRWERRLHDRHR
jgi:uncharacterized protein